MTESSNTEQGVVRLEAVGGPSYGDLQESAPNEVRAAWKGADARSRDLIETYHALQNDPKYTDAYKSEQAWSHYEKALPRITKDREKARELLAKEAAYHEERGIPRPKGEMLQVGTTERLLAAQNQAARVVRMVERQEKRSASSGSPIGKPSLPTLLKDEFARGIKAGGVEGATTCKGVLMAAEELGVDADSFLDPLRTPEHMESLDKARRFEQMAQHISTQVPEPPFPRPGSGQNTSQGSKNRNVFLRDSGQATPIRKAGGAFGARRKPSWK